MTVPMISIITPSYNCAPHIRQCIESVLGQKYANCEHIIVDGASRDGTISILREYAHLRWISEPDVGEGQALNKGLKLVRGDIIGWLNADDYYLEGAFQAVARELRPDEGRHVVYGKTELVDADGRPVGVKASSATISLPFLLRWWEYRRHPHQPSVFYSRELVEGVGPFREDLTFSIDYDYWLRAIMSYEFHYVDRPLAAARMRHGGKSMQEPRDQIASHRQVNSAYMRHLSGYGRLKLWTDFWTDYWVPTSVTRVRRRLAIRTRMRRGLAWLRQTRVRPAGGGGDGSARLRDG